MRTLKKTLCLVLVLAMMVGLCAMAASAVKLDDYPDKDAIQHKEAVAVLSALGVLEGDSNGFRPADTLTRAEGAAFMTRLLAATGAGISSFTDMGAAAWAQPYVAYCEQNKIIAGMGDGTFHPQDTLTVLQFAKMMLCALGYDPAREGLINDAAWEINTIKLINQIDLTAGITSMDYNAPITRDAAAQLAFNTLKAAMVEYVGGTDINVNTGDGTKVEVKDHVAATPRINNSYDYRNDLDNNDYYYERAYGNYMQFCENYFPNLKLTQMDDSYKIPTAYWWMGNSRKDVAWSPLKNITSAVTGNVMKVYDTSMLVSAKALYADAKATATSVQLHVYENGADAGFINVGKNDGASMPIIGYSGATVYLIDTDKEGQRGFGIADRLVVKYPLVAKVAKVTAATNKAARSIDLDIYANEGSVNATKLAKYETDKYAKGDIILVYPKNVTVGELKKTTFPDGLIETAVPDAVNGTLTRVTMNNKQQATALTVAGVSYPAGSALLANLGPTEKTPVGTADTNYFLGTGMTAYMNNGFVLGVVADAVTYGNYVYAYGTEPKTGVFSTTCETGIVKQDASTDVITFDNVLETGADAKKGQYDDGEVAGKWATISEVGSAKTIKLDVTESKDFETKELKPGTATITNILLGGENIVADAKTTFVIQSAGKFKSYTGIGAVPGYKMETPNSNGKYMTGVALVPGGDPTKAHAVAVFINVDGSTPISGKADSIFMTTGVADYKAFEDGKTVFYYTAIIDGAKKDDIKGSEDTFNGISGLVTPTYTAGVLTGVTKVAVKAVDPDSLVLVNSVSTYNVGKDTAIPLSVVNGNMVFTDVNKNVTEFVVDGNATVIVYNSILKEIDTTKTTIADLNGEEGVVTLVRASKDDDTVKTIYLVQ